MNTIADARKYVIENLRRGSHGSIAAPELTADLLLGFVLERDRVFVLAHPEYLMTNDVFTRLEGLVARRRAGEPLQYILGEWEFYGRPFYVTPAVLIPRPETELLVEAALDIIKNRFPWAVSFADVGTGSGCIAVSVLREIAYARGRAIDCSRSALAVAAKNARRHGVAERLTLRHGDLLDSRATEEDAAEKDTKEVFDLILSNPPYVARMDYNDLPVEVRKFEPELALFGGDDGYAVYRRLIPAARARLRQGGYLLLELGAGQADEVTRLAGAAGLRMETVIQDLQGIARCLVARNP